MSESPAAIADIIAVVAVRHNVSPALLRGSSTRRHLIPPRHLAMWLAHNILGKSASEIGRAFGGRDHTTVLSAINNAHRWTEGRTAQDIWGDYHPRNAERRGTGCQPDTPPPATPRTEMTWRARV